MTRPQRYGITGFAIGSSNINCLLDKKGFKDMYKNELLTTEIAIGDELAAAASILMGQCDERQPIVLISGYKDTSEFKTNAKSLGVLKKDIAERYGFNSQCQVYGGAGDNAAAAVGLGLYDEGDASLSLGTSGVIFGSTKKFLKKEKISLPLHHRE